MRFCVFFLHLFLLFIPLYAFLCLFSPFSSLYLHAMRESGEKCQKTPIFYYICVFRWKSDRFFYFFVTFYPHICVFHLFLHHFLPLSGVAGEMCKNRPISPIYAFLGLFLIIFHPFLYLYMRFSHFYRPFFTLFCPMGCVLWGIGKFGKLCKVSPNYPYICVLAWKSDRFLHVFVLNFYYICIFLENIDRFSPFCYL